LPQFGDENKKIFIWQGFLAQPRLRKEIFETDLWIYFRDILTSHTLSLDNENRRLMDFAFQIIIEELIDNRKRNTLIEIISASPDLSPQFSRSIFHKIYKDYSDKMEDIFSTWLKKYVSNRLISIKNPIMISEFFDLLGLGLLLGKSFKTYIFNLLKVNITNVDDQYWVHIDEEIIEEKRATNPTEIRKIAKYLEMQMQGKMNYSISHFIAKCKESLDNGKYEKAGSK
jgi:hypothetical protein